MKLHLLLTPDIAATRPESVKVIADWGDLIIVHQPEEQVPTKMHCQGRHCFVEGSEQDIVTWLKPFDGFWQGDGNPMAESFHIAHIKQGDRT